MITANKYLRIGIPLMIFSAIMLFPYWLFVFKGFHNNVYKNTEVFYHQLIVVVQQFIKFSGVCITPKVRFDKYFTFVFEKIACQNKMEFITDVSPTKRTYSFI